MKDNKLIAEFMGIEEAYNPNGNDWVLKTTTPDVNGDTDILESYKGNELQYHSSWDWLMPVMAELVKNFGSGWIFEEGYDLNTRYNAVVEFIKQIESKNPKSVKIYEKKNVIAGVDFSESINQLIHLRCLKIER
jgi:hypothetical protein|tara:strand:- start:11 stop:412 length:402 start_codon:yes stop_codon:yes gene_type:complete